MKSLEISKGPVALLLATFAQIVLFLIINTKSLDAWVIGILIYCRQYYSGMFHGGRQRKLNAR